MGMIQLLQDIMAGFGLGQVPHPLRQQLLGYAVGQAEETAPLLPPDFPCGWSDTRDSAAKAL